MVAAHQASAPRVFGLVARGEALRAYVAETMLPALEPLEPAGLPGDPYRVAAAVARSAPIAACAVGVGLDRDSRYT